MLYRVKDDLESGRKLRVGLPSTVRIQGGNDYVMLTPAWMNYVWNINDPPGQQYQFVEKGILQEAIGWHNTGKPNRVEQLTFSGNIIEVYEIVENRAYIRSYFVDQAPPVEIIKPTAGNLNPKVQLLTTQYSNKLDITTNGKYPRTLIIANPGEKLWIDTKEIVKIGGNNMLIGYDYWEGNPEIDEATIASVVKFVSIRLNHMGGGHHLDTLFKKHWVEAAGFLRFFYFVYNPWVDGLTNWNWLKANMPADTPPRFAVDVEVIYAGYSKSTYAQQVDYFIQKALDSGMKPVVYTGGWFLPYLSTWRADVPYWWARYPTAAKPSASPTTFQDLIAKMGALTWSPDPLKQSPGEVKIWQVNDQWQLPGSGLHAVDINLWNGTLQELTSWINGTNIPPVVVDPSNPVTVDRLPAFKAELAALLTKPEYN